jgi:nicotinamidase-related amidase
VGVSVNIAIQNLTFDAVNAGYQVVLPVDAIAGTPRAYAEQVFEHTLRNVATLVSTDDVLRAWT